MKLLSNRLANLGIEVPGWLQAINADFGFTWRFRFFPPSTFIKAHPGRLVDCTALYVCRGKYYTNHQLAERS